MSSSLYRSDEFGKVPLDKFIFGEPVFCWWLFGSEAFAKLRYPDLGVLAGLAGIVVIALDCRGRFE